MLHIRIKTQIDQSNTQVTFAGDFLGTSTWYWHGFIRYIYISILQFRNK